MPQLPNYLAQVSPAPINSGRAATADDFGGGVAAAVGDFAVTADKVAHHVENKISEDEQRKVLVETSQIRAKYARELDNAAASGADLDKIKENMANELAAVGQSLSTRRGQDSLAVATANTEIMYDQQANQIGVSRAGAQARMDGSKFVNNASAIIQSNPGYLKVAEQDADALLATFSRLPPERRAELADGMKKDLNMAAAIAASRMDPEGTRKKLEAGEWNLSPEQRNIAINKAESETRAKRVEEDYLHAKEQQKRVELDEKSRDQWFKGIIDGTASRRKIMDDPNLRPATREHLINVMESRAKELRGGAVKTDPVTERNLWMAINAPDGDPRKIYNGDAIFAAVQAGKLSTDDANRLNSLVAAQKDPNGRGFPQRLNQQMGIVARTLAASPQYANQPDLSAAIQMKLITDVTAKSEALRKENKDPSVLLDPDSKDYYFKPGLLKQTADAVVNGKVAEGVPVQAGQEMEADGRRWSFKGGDPKNPKNYIDLGPVEGNAKGGAKSGVIRQPNSGGGPGGGGGGGDRPNSAQGAADYDATYGMRRVSATGPDAQTGLSTRPLNAQEALAAGDKKLAALLKEREKKDKR